MTGLEDQHVPLSESNEQVKHIEKSNTFLSKKQLIVIVISLVVFSSYLFFMEDSFIIFNSDPVQKFISDFKIRSQNSTKSIIPIKSQTKNVTSFKLSDDVCLHPKIDYFDPEIMKFYPPPPVCNGTFQNVTYLAEGKLKTWQPEKYDCWGRCQTYSSNKKNKEGPWFHTDNNTVFGCDIVEARCSIKPQPFWNTSYFYIHTQLVEVKINKPKYSVDGKQYSVYFIVVDSQAHSQTFRNLNMTNTFLTNEMGAIHFAYVNRLAGRSRENAIAWWFGKIWQTFDRSAKNLSPLQPEPKWTVKANCKRTLDEDVFLIKEFAEYGYVTNLAEDWFGTMDYECKGFKKMVAHHSYMPYVLLYEKNKQLRNFLENTQCLQEGLRHKHLLDYGSQFVSSYPGKLKLEWLWLVWAGHNNEWGSKQADPDLLAFFKKHREEFDNSFVFLAGDHGMRFTNAVKTKVGKYDVNNPLLMMTVPKELRKNAELMKTLKKNSKELQTHFDTRATLLDILKYQPSANFNDRSFLEIEGELGHSYFREQPKPRTCKTLPIPPEFCICESQVNENLVKSNPECAKSLGETIVSLLNKKLVDAGFPSQCRPWKFKETQSLTQVSVYPLHIQGVVLAETDKTQNGQINVFLTGKDDSSLEIVTFDRMDRYGRSGDCAEKSIRPICDCY